MFAPVSSLMTHLNERIINDLNRWLQEQYATHEISLIIKKESCSDALSKKKQEVFWSDVEMGGVMSGMPKKKITC